MGVYSRVEWGLIVSIKPYPGGSFLTLGTYSRVEVRGTNIFLSHFSVTFYGSRSQRVRWQQKGSIKDMVLYVYVDV